MYYYCRLRGFKAKQIPADYVLQISGQPCMKFAEKKEAPSSSKK